MSLAFIGILISTLTRPVFARHTIIDSSEAELKVKGIIGVPVVEEKEWEDVIVSVPKIAEKKDVGNDHLPKLGSSQRYGFLCLGLVLVLTTVALKKLTSESNK